MSVQACGYYSFKGSLPSHIETVAIPLFEDRTAYPGVRESITNKVIDGFISDNTLQVVDESKADLMINGTITSISQREATVTSGEVVTNVKVIVSVKVKCEDVKTNKVLYDKNFQQFGLIDANAGLEERNAAIEEAVELITEDIINSTLGAW